MRLSTSRFFFGMVYLLILGMTACVPIPDLPTPTLTQDTRLTPFIFPSATPTPTPVVASPSPKPFPPTPTATPFQYRVVSGDTMLGIAFRFGIELQDLLTANPTVDPQFLSVGTDLVIPLQEDVQSQLAGPTPVPVSVDAPTCYSQVDESAWCFALAHNRTGESVENVRVQVAVFDGEVQTDVFLVDPLLNRLASGEKMPIGFLLPAWSPETNTAVSLQSAVAVGEDDPRYITGNVQLTALGFSADRLVVRVEGQAALGAVPGSVWVLVVGYSEKGLPVGVRRWEAPAAALQETTIPFAIDLYSAGDKIVNVDVLFEARP